MQTRKSQRIPQQTIVQEEPNPIQDSSDEEVNDSYSSSSGSGSDYDEAFEKAEAAKKKKGRTSKKSFFAIESLPVDILLWVMDYIPMESKYALTRSSPNLFHLLPPNPDAENHARWRFSDYHLNQLRGIKYPWICFIRLCHDERFKICGCDRCGRQKIRKTFWSLGYRLCDNCKNNATINDYYLTSNYDLSHHEFRNAPHNVGQIYQRYNRQTITGTWYLVPSINKILRAKYGHDLNDPDALRQAVEVRRQEARERQAQEMEERQAAERARRDAEKARREAVQLAKQRAKLQKKKDDKDHFESLSVEEKRAIRKEKMLAYCAALNPPLVVEGLASFDRFCQRTEYSINASPWVKKFRAELQQAEE